MIAPWVLWIALARPAAAQNVQWDVNAATTAAAQLGEPFALTGTLASDAPQDLTFDLASSTGDSYAVSNAVFGKTVLRGGSRIQPFSADILPLAVGKIAAFLACDLPSATQPRRFLSPPIYIDVAPPNLPKNAAPRDIKAPRRARPPFWPWLVLAAVLAAGYALYRKFSGAKKSEAQGPPPDLRPAEVIAESDLEALQKSGLWESGRHKDFYSALTDILRRYLERRYGFCAPQMTTAELCRTLRQADFDRAILTTVKSVLDRADLIKFAKIAPESGWGPSDIASSFDIVRNTTPRPAAPEPPKQEAKASA